MIAIINAIVKNAPGAKIIISVLGNCDGRTVIPKKVPAPIISRILPISKRAVVKPKPMKKPSAVEWRTLFFDAKTSALANGIQFTTINGINIPKDLSRSGK